jgi:hypothetical protein
VFRVTEFNGLSIRILLAFILFLPVTAGCIGPRYWDGYVGKVVDADTGEPMEDVFVIARYWGDIPQVVDFQTVCYHATGTTTNTQGEYRMSPHFDAPDFYMDKRSKISFFKPGYRSVYYKGGIAKMRKDEGSRKERLDYLRRMAGKNCRGAGESKRALFPYFQSIYYEAKSISVSTTEKNQLQQFRRWAASKAIAQDSDQGVSSTEYNKLIDDYLKDHLK